MIIAAVALIALVIGAVLVMKGASGSNTAGPSPSVSGNVKAASSAPTDKVQVTDEVTGTGTEAKEGSTISAKYTGTTADGAVFDSTDKHGGQPATFTLAKGQLIDGWVQGIPGMKVGGKRKLVIPPDLGYGANPPQGSGIPANATLTFEIELTNVQ
jgi:peptidylprolyl isomerase